MEQEEVTKCDKAPEHWECSLELGHEGPCNATRIHYGRGYHPNTIKGLTPFQKGKSGNPNGRPRGSRNRGTILRSMMKLRVRELMPAKWLEDNPEFADKNMYEAAALGQFKAAMRGSTQAWQEIQDTLFGPIPKKLEGDLNLNFSMLAKAAQAALSEGEVTDDE